jgi:hypothetical protein
MDEISGAGSSPAPFVLVRLRFSTLFASRRLRAYPLLMESKAGSNFLLCRASLSEKRFALFPAHSNTTF